MPVVDRFRYLAEVFVDGESLARLPVSPDWDAALQSAHWQAVRRGRVAPLTHCSAATIRPLWQEDYGQPHVGAFSVILDSPTHPDTESPAAEEIRVTVPRTYLRSAVVRAASRLVEEGTLRHGERFLYELSAYPVGEGLTPAALSRQLPAYSAEEVPQRLPLVPASLAEHTAAATPSGDDLSSEEDMPLFVPARVIGEAAELARRDPEIETGGLLIGRLHRDTQSPEVFAVVTAFISARHTIADPTRLTFTAETWAAAQAALDLRGGDELLLGWAHSHPCWCAGCPPERRRLCPLMKPFFSSDDIALHRTVFPAGYNIALLLSDLGEADLRLDVFGWRNGLVKPRGYYVSGGPPPLSSSMAAASPAGAAHGSSLDDDRDPAARLPASIDPPGSRREAQCPEPAHTETENPRTGTTTEKPAR